MPRTAICPANAPASDQTRMSPRHAPAPARRARHKCSSPPRPGPCPDDRTGGLCGNPQTRRTATCGTPPPPPAPRNSGTRSAGTPCRRHTNRSRPIGPPPDPAGYGCNQQPDIAAAALPNRCRTLPNAYRDDADLPCPAKRPSCQIALAADAKPPTVARRGRPCQARALARHTPRSPSPRCQGWPQAPRAHHPPRRTGAAICQTDGKPCPTPPLPPVIRVRPECWPCPSVKAGTNVAGRPVRIRRGPEPAPNRPHPATPQPPPSIHLRQNARFAPNARAGRRRPDHTAPLATADPNRARRYVRQGGRHHARLPR